MQLTRINYSELNSKQKEIYNFQKISGVLADYGFNCIKLSDDWHGADFLAYHKDGNDTLKVQLKSRLSIDRKYMGKDLHIAFPLGSSWFLIKHDDLIQSVSETTNWLNTSSWKDKGIYNSASPSQKLLQAIGSNQLAGA